MFSTETICVHRVVRHVAMKRRVARMVRSELIEEALRLVELGALELIAREATARREQQQFGEVLRESQVVMVHVARTARRLPTARECRIAQPASAHDIHRRNMLAS